MPVHFFPLLSFREYIRPDGSVGLRSVAGWYERHENNGWRPVSERVLLEEDPVTTMTRLRRLPFFHFRSDRTEGGSREWGRGAGQGMR